MIGYITFALILAHAVVGTLGNPTATSCIYSNDTCALPDCVCGSPNPPPYDGWTSADYPQMIYLIFEQSLNTGDYAPYYQPLLNAVKNPNGCPISATFFIDHKYTDYTSVSQAWQDGYDIGVQSITNTVFTSESNVTIHNETAGEAYYLKEFALLDITKVRGAKAPSAASPGDSMFHAQIETGLEFDASLVYREYSTPLWPYTLDYLPQHTCASPSICPTESYPGYWEFPVNDFIDGNNFLCSNLYQCIYNLSIPDAYTLLKYNSDYYFKSATPMAIVTPLSWLYTQSNVDGLVQFLTEAVNAGAYVISLSQAMEWFKNPIKVSEIAASDVWGCGVNRTFACTATRCNYNLTTGESVSFGFCNNGGVSTCPGAYPWIDNLPDNFDN